MIILMFGKFYFIFLPFNNSMVITFTRVKIAQSIQRISLHYMEPDRKPESQAPMDG